MASFATRARDLLTDESALEIPGSHSFQSVEEVAAVCLAIRARRKARTAALAAQVEASAGTLVWGVRLLARADRSWSGGSTEDIALPRAEFEAIVGSNIRPPVPHRLGLDLAVRRDDPHAGANRHATLLMIRPADGFAPPSWQIDANGAPGTCTVVRRSGAPFSAEDHYWLHEYLNELVNVIDEDSPPTPQQLSVVQFQNFLQRVDYYCSDEQATDVAYYQRDRSALHVALPCVVLRGLEARPDLNGREGYREALAADGRYPVYLCPPRSQLTSPTHPRPIAVRAANTRRIDTCARRRRGLLKAAWVFLALHRRAAERTYAPGGAGYRMAELSFAGRAAAEQRSDA